MTTTSYYGYSSYSTYSPTAVAGSATEIPLTPTGGTTVHDLWLIITPLQGGEFALVLTAQGLQPGGTYLIEGITTGAQTNIVPLASTASTSEFTANNQGNGIYSQVFVINPQTAYSSVLLLYLPNNQMESGVLVASATLG